jgi:hypothetical protein
MEHPRRYLRLEWKPVPMRVARDRDITEKRSAL